MTTTIGLISFRSKFGLLRRLGVSLMRGNKSERYPLRVGMDSMLRLNLGAADRQIHGFVSVDIAPPADVIADLSERWPWPDSSVDEIVAYDVVEHIADRVKFMNEMHRVLKPGAMATIETPNAARGAGFFQDPTHCSPWCLNSFQYFEAGSFAHRRLARSYRITAAFEIAHLSQRRYRDEYETVWKITANLRAVK